MSKHKYVALFLLLLFLLSGTACSSKAPDSPKIHGDGKVGEGELVSNVEISKLALVELEHLSTLDVGDYNQFTVTELATPQTDLVSGDVYPNLYELKGQYKYDGTTYDYRMVITWASEDLTGYSKVITYENLTKKTFESLVE